MTRRGLVIIWAGVAPESTHCDVDTMQVEVTNKSGQLEATVQPYVDNQHRACHKPISRPLAQLMTTPDVRTLVCTRTGMRPLSLGCQKLIYSMDSTSMSIVPNYLLIIRYSGYLDLTTWCASGLPLRVCPYFGGTPFSIRVASAEMEAEMGSLEATSFNLPADEGEETSGRSRRDVGS